MVKKAAGSPYFRAKSKLSPDSLNTSEKIIEIILIVLVILAVVSIPFLWLGVIKKLAIKANVAE